MERAQLSIEWLQSARLDRNWTQEYVAEQVGVEVSTIRRWEYGQNKPQLRQYYQLCKLFQKPLPPGLQGGSEEREDVQTPAREKRQLPPVEEIADACTKFQATDLTLRLLHILWSWSLQRGKARYQTLQSLLMQEIEQKDNTMHEHLINRRNALRRIAVLPIEMYSLSLIASTSLHSPEELLIQCAAGITACWYLRKGKDLAFANDVASRYIPSLEKIAINGKGTQRKEVAELLVQCFLLKSTLSWHLGANSAVAYAQSAEKYAVAARSTLLQVVALRTQAAAYSYENRWDLALDTAGKAGHLLETEQSVPVSQLVQSYVYAGLATYQSYDRRRKQDAFVSLEKAHVSFHNAQAAKEILPVWIDHNHANLVLNDGMTHYHLGLYEKARDSFAQTKEIQQDDAGRVEILIDEVAVELERDDQARDMDWCIATWTQGIEGAKALQSEQWFGEAVAVHRTMLAAWPGEQSVKKLKDLIVHW